MLIIWIILGAIVVFALVRKLMLDMLAIVVGVFLLLSLVPLPVVYFENVSMIQEYYALQDTVMAAREDKEIDLERAAIMVKVAEMNMNVRRAQYWNQAMFGAFSVFYPNHIMELEPIK